VGPYLTSWARHIVACWEPWVLDDVLALLPEAPGACDQRDLGVDDEADSWLAAEWVRRRLDEGPPDDTCPGAWWRAATSFQTLEDMRDRQYVRETGQWHDAYRAETVSDALRRFAGPPTSDECAEGPPHAAGRLTLVADIRANAEEFDREVGGWFGRPGAQPDDPSVPELLSNHWSPWLLFGFAITDEGLACRPALAPLLSAFRTLRDRADALSGYLAGAPGYSYWSGDDLGSVSDALDRDLELGLLRLGGCWHLAMGGRA